MSSTAPAPLTVPTPAPTVWCHAGDPADGLRQLKVAGYRFETGPRLAEAIRSGSLRAEDLFGHPVEVRFLHAPA